MWAGTDCLCFFFFLCTPVPTHSCAHTRPTASSSLHQSYKKELRQLQLRWAACHSPWSGRALWLLWPISDLCKYVGPELTISYILDTVPGSPELPHEKSWSNAGGTTYRCSVHRLSWAYTPRHWNSGARPVNNTILDPLDQSNLLLNVAQKNHPAEPCLNSWPIWSQVLIK